MKRKTLVAMLALCATASIAAPAAAPAPEGDLQGWSLALENDFFGRATISTDRWYTNGLHYAHSYRKGRPLHRPLELVREMGREYFGVKSTNGNASTAAESFGHNIYTPNDVDPSTPQVYDRPYAALLYYGLGAFAYDGNAHRAIDLRIGVVGPAAGGDELQSGIHRLIDDGLPNGWAYQVRPRLALQGTWTHTQRYVDQPQLPHWGAIHLHGRATVGTVKNLVAAGITFVAGEKTRVFGAPDEGDFVAVDFNNRQNSFRAGWLRRTTFFAQMQMAAVASNYLIEGRTYGPRPEIELKRGVWMSTFGVSQRLSREWRLEYRIKRRSAEFKAAEPYGRNGQIQSYGEVRLVRDYDASPDEVEGFMR
jgi:lipid A 3-O-deacylase